MKKGIVLLVLILLNITVYFCKSGQAYVEKIDFNLEDGEYLVLFLPDMLFIGSQKEDYLIPLEDDINLDNLQDFDIKKIDYLISSKDYDVSYKKRVDPKQLLMFKNIKIIEDENLEIDIYNQKICVLNSGTECDHVFLKSDSVEIDKSLKTLFFEEKYVDLIKPKLFKKWIDAYTIIDDCYTFLKITKDNYEVIVIPKNNE